MSTEDEFTYTTDLIRNLFAAGVLEYGGGVEEESKADFDRWLTAHDAEIRTAALEEARVIAASYYDFTVAATIHAAKVGD